MLKTTTLLAAGLTLLPLAASHAQASKGFSREGARSQVARPNPINKFHAIDRVLGSLPGAKDALWTDYLNKCQSDVDPERRKEQGLESVFLSVFPIESPKN